MHFRLFNLFFLRPFLGVLDETRWWHHRFTHCRRYNLHRRWTHQCFLQVSVPIFLVKNWSGFWAKRKNYVILQFAQQFHAWFQKKICLFCFYFMTFQVSEQLETQHQWRSQVWRRSLLVPNFFLPTQGSTHVSPCQRWANAMRNRSWSLNS